MQAKEPGRLTTGQLLAFCIYAMPLVATTAAIGNFVTPYYSEALGLPLASVAAALLVIRVFDAMFDPLIGLAIDRSRFRQKHRPWLLLALPVYLIGAGLVFFPPFANVSQIYLIAAGAVVYAAYTTCMVVHQAWAASLTSDPRQLSRIFGYRELAVIGGIMGVFGLAAIASHQFAGDITAQAHAAGAFILTVVTLATVVTWSFTPDPRVERAKAHSPQSSALRELLLSRDFGGLLFAVLFFNAAWTAMSAMGFFVARYLYRAPALFAVGLTVTFLVAPIGMALWMRLAARWGDRRTLIASCLYLAVVVALLPLAVRHGGTGLLAIQALLGIGFGAGPYLTRALIGNIANAHVARTGSDLRGTAFAAATFFDKLGSGLGAAALIPLAWFGFDPNRVVDGRADAALLGVATVAPVLSFLLTALFARTIGGVPRQATTSQS
ncbi:MAG: MFS transporter [Proteobacteria bacterium]|nr:MFS transporter [Pseudomonadota bacterium]